MSVRCDHMEMTGSGPNALYGFGSQTSDRSPSTMTDHEEAIREFLSAIDPKTGHMEDDDEDEDDEDEDDEDEDDEDD